MSGFARAVSEEDLSWLPPRIIDRRSGLVLDEDEVALDLLPERDRIVIKQRPRPDAVNKGQVISAGFHPVSQQSHDHAAAGQRVLAEARVVGLKFPDAIFEAGIRHFGFSFSLSWKPSGIAGVLTIVSPLLAGGAA